MEDKPIEIQFSKFKLMLMFLGSLIFVVISICLILSVCLSINIGRIAPAFILIIGIIGLAIFVPIGLYLVKTIYSFDPGITISEKGLTDNSGALSVGFIEWEDIIDIHDITISRQAYINIVVKDPNKYISRQKNSFKRWWLRLNYKTYGTVIGITAARLKCKHGELRQLLREKFSQFKG